LARPGGAQAPARCWLAETATDTDQVRIRLQFLDVSSVELGVVDPAFTSPRTRPYFRSKLWSYPPRHAQDLGYLTFAQVRTLLSAGGSNERVC
jgi:hypothetical protein